MDRSRWRFDDGEHLTLDGDFQAFHWYELTYRTNRTPVVGCGLLALRDFATHLRSRGFDRVLGFGESQCGRFLRQFLFDGLNVDETGLQAFDGILSSTAGAARGEFNHRYAQPPLTEVHGFGDQPPFSHQELLGRQREMGGLPKVIMTNSAWEYWRGDAALQHVDRYTGDDLDEDPDVRTYLLAGTDHFGALDVKGAFPAENATHTLDPTPIHRALFVALDAWLDGVSPPASQIPRTTDRTATSRAEVLARFGHVPRPDVEALPRARRVDLGPAARDGVGQWPAALGSFYPDLVSAVDDDGNEIAGVKLPAVSVPCAVYTGWNPRRRISGLPTALYERLGSTMGFPPDRPTATERYASRDEYAAAVAEAAESLVASRLLLAQDIRPVTREALRAYDDALQLERNDTASSTDPRDEAIPTAAIDRQAITSIDTTSMNGSP
ncbi:MAG: alpha/beta hydrolase domain-containing protein [Mycobacterium sp.]